MRKKENSLKRAAKGLARIQLPVLFLLCLTMVGVTAGFLVSTDSVLNRLSSGHNTAGIVESYAPPTSFSKGDEIKKEVTKKISVPSYLFFSPVFFASVGLKVNLEGLNGSMLIFSLLLLAVAILTKIVGCGLGAKLCGFSNEEAVQVGVGMISRGEVALIVAQKGYAMGLMSAALFPPIVLVVIATTIITPVILKRIM